MTTLYFVIFLYKHYLKNFGTTAVVLKLAAAAYAVHTKRGSALYINFKLFYYRAVTKHLLVR